MSLPGMHPQNLESLPTSASRTTSLLRSWSILEYADVGQPTPGGGTSMPPQALDALRNAIDPLFARHLAKRGKPRWCDKSLDSYQNPDLLAALYPRTRFICLYRHCMDVIASGIEACPWGVTRYGFDPYVARAPGNNVAAIGSYWADTIAAILAFEERETARCTRIRYEDLVTAPEEVTGRLLRFLGAAPMPDINALDCYRSGRVLLRDQLGIEPGQILRSMHARILADDPRLTAPPLGQGPAGRR